MEIAPESIRNCVSFGSIISIMNDFLGNNETPKISYDPSEPYHNYSQNKKTDYDDYLKSGLYLYSNGVFNEFCCLHSFKDKNDFQNKYFKYIIFSFTSL